MSALEVMVLHIRIPGYRPGLHIQLETLHADDVHSHTSLYNLLDDSQIESLYRHVSDKMLVNVVIQLGPK